MAQVLRQNTLTDQNARPIAGANIYVYDNTGVPAVLTSDGTTPLSQPVITDTFGNYKYYANTGVYTEDLFLGTRRIWEQVIAIGTGADVSTLAALSASGGSALVGFQQSGTGSASRTVQAKLRDVVSLKDFGAIGDGAADDTTAINSWLAALTTGSIGFAPAGTYKFTSALIKTTARISIFGEGPYQTVFQYAGANTTNDIFTLGDGTTALTNCYLRGFRITSSTTMTSGYGLHLKRFQRSAVTNIVIDGQDGGGKFYHGLYFDELDDVDLIDFDIKAAQDGLSCSGTVAGGQAGLMLFQGKIAGCAVGFRIGGGMGGVYGDQVDIVANGRNLVIDTTLRALANREIIIGPSFAVDSSSAGPNIQISDTLATGSSVLQMDGTWNSSANTHGIQIDASVNYLVTVVGGDLFNCAGDALRNNSTTAQIVFAPARVTNCTGYGINSTVANPNIYVNASVGYWASNTAGNIGPNITSAVSIGQFGALTFGGSAKSSSPSGGIGYTTGSGGAVTQITSRTTGVTLNTVCGQITLFSAAGSAAWQTFTVTDSAVAAVDIIRLSQASGTDKYMLHVTGVRTGAFDITFATTGGTTTEQPVINFAVMKGSAS